MEKDLVSVIVPVYNVEKYLEKCLDSIINQTYKNLEIILIDDGSTDKSLSICKKYQKIDKRIKLFVKKHNGVAEARNDGIKYSTGKYVFFVDSDDYVDLDIIEFLYNSINNTSNEIDIATCMYKVVYENCDTDNISEKNYKYLCDAETALESLLYFKDCGVNPVAKLYKRELFDNILFPKGKICEDLAVTYKLFAKSKNIIINTSKKYYYYQRENSIMHSKFTKDRMVGLNFALEQTKFIKEKYPSLVKASINREFMEAIYIALNMPFTNEFKSEIEMVKKVVFKYRKTVLFDKKATLSSKLYAFFSYFGLKNMVMFHKFYIKIKGRKI